MLMRIKKCIPACSTCLLAVVLVIMCAANVYAQTLTAQLATRPITPEDITNYGLPSTTETTGSLVSCKMSLERRFVSHTR